MAEIYGQFKTGAGRWTPQAKDRAEATAAKALTATNTVGAAYMALQTPLEYIQKYQEGPKGSTDRVALADMFTRVINNNRALRGFQLKMLTDHAGLVNQLVVLAQQARMTHGGGSISDEQANDMIRIVTGIAAETTNQFGLAVTSAQLKAAGSGLNPNGVVPDVFHPEAISELTGTPAPSSAAVDHLNQLLAANPKGALGTKRLFDQIFSPGAADWMIARTRLEQLHAQHPDLWDDSYGVPQEAGGAPGGEYSYGVPPDGVPPDDE
jgi:hypothetical protein